MDYQKHYDALISRAKGRLLEGYVEIHHIVPKCLGGLNEISNLVQLTAEEHYVAHQLLVKIYPNNSKLLYAAKVMASNSSGGRSNNKLYSWLRKRHSEILKDGQASKMRAQRKNNSLDEKTKKKIGEGNTGKIRTEQMRKTTSITTKEGMNNPDTKKKQREAKLGKPNLNPNPRKGKTLEEYYGEEIGAEKRIKRKESGWTAEKQKKALNSRLKHHAERKKDPNSKFSNEVIQKILDLLAEGISQIKIAKQLNVSQPFVSQVKLGKVAIVQ